MHVIEIIAAQLPGTNMVEKHDLARNILEGLRVSGLDPDELAQRLAEVEHGASERDARVESLNGQVIEQARQIAMLTDERDAFAALNRAQEHAVSLVKSLGTGEPIDPQVLAEVVEQIAAAGG